MKILKTFIICISLVSFLSCDKKDSEDPNNVSVVKYVEDLRNGTYDSPELPDFTYKDISTLLEYRDEAQIITDFPANIISSSVTQECSLGMYILWTIESIRAVAIDSKYLIGRFPSQNPVVQKRDQPFAIEDQNDIQEIISKSYFDWWNNNSNKEFSEFKHIDPLQNTEYRWH